MKHESNTDGEKTLDRSKPRAKRSLEPISGVGRELPRRGLDVGVGGKRWVKRWVNLGKGGQEAGKWCSFSHLETAFSHLFPPFSTQVVDFPHICTVRLFWEEGFHRRDAEAQRQAKLGTEMGSGKWSGVLDSRESQPACRRRGVLREKLRIVTRKCAKFRESPQKFAQIRPVNPRLFGLLHPRAFLDANCTNERELETIYNHG